VFEIEFQMRFQSWDDAVLVNVQRCDFLAE